MELSDRQLPHTQKYGTEVVALTAGQKFRIQKWIEGEGIVDILAEVTVPAGKAWSVSVIVDISETDV